MSAKIKGLLQKINFIETDMELHKQILVSIPSNRKKEMEKVLIKISDQKKEIEMLRLEIKKEDEDEYNRILAMEKASLDFRKLAEIKEFELVRTLNETGECHITLNEGTRIECLVAAREKNGDWTVLTLEGETKVYPAGIVKR